jgi:hypothetical protein
MKIYVSIPMQSYNLILKVLINRVKLQKAESNFVCRNYKHTFGSRFFDKMCSMVYHKRKTFFHIKNLPAIYFDKSKDARKVRLMLKLGRY